MSRLIELVKSGASIKEIKADLWDNRQVDGYVNIQRRPHGMTALMWAAKNGDSHMVDLLLKEGADANAQNNYGNSALVWACRRGFTDIIEKLTDAGADTNVATIENGNSPLMEAVHREDIEQVKLLLSKGANVNHVNNVGISSIRWAIFRNNFELIKLLLEAGANNVDDLNRIINHENQQVRSLLQIQTWDVINGKRYLLVEVTSN